MAYPAYIRQKAVDLRVTRKLTIDEIAERLGVAKTTVFYWVGDLVIPETEKQTVKRQAASDANRRQAWRKRMDAYREGHESFVGLCLEPTFRDFVCMYIGEGTKRNRNVVAICNSDPAVVSLGNRWISRLARNPVRYSIQYHADQAVEELRQFWATEIEVEPSVIKFQRKSNSGRLGGRSWRSVHGVLTVTCSDTELRAQIQAWMDLVRAEWD